MKIGDKVVVNPIMWKFYYDPPNTIGTIIEIYHDLLIVRWYSENRYENDIYIDCKEVNNITRELKLKRILHGE